jgi:hypothetical protein
MSTYMKNPFPLLALVVFGGSALCISAGFNLFQTWWPPNTESAVINPLIAKC